jgi:tetratricopeptide (TPR) repeat protein
MDKKEFLLSGYEITGDENLHKKLQPIPYELDIQLDDLYYLALKGKKSAIKKFIRLIHKYPKVPMLKNYLSVLYSNLGQIEKSHEVNHWIVAEHPDYLFGKLNLAAEYFMKEEYERMPEILGEYMELKRLYPNRNVFHQVEVSGFFKMAVLYYSATGNLEQAEIRLEILREIMPDSSDLEVAEKHFTKGKTENAIYNLHNNGEDLIEVEVNKTVLTDITTPPAFTHKQINLLYQNDIDIDKKIVDEIMALPRQSLIKDLNRVLKDSITRFNYFNTNTINGNFGSEENSFVIHALFILAEIEADESLWNILEVLRQDNDYLELFLEDVLTEYMWMVLYKTASAKLETCKQFMFEPGIYTYSKTSLSEMVSQIALHNPGRKEEAIKWFCDVFRFFLNSKLKDNVIDSSLLGNIVYDAMSIGAKESIPEIERLFEKKLVDLSVCGDIKEIKEGFTNFTEWDSKHDIASIYSKYEEIQSWSGSKDGDNYYDDDNDVMDDKEDYHSNNSNNEQPVSTSKKIGRNDPCPCGSGKKYKKCCLVNKA